MAEERRKGGRPRKYAVGARRPVMSFRMSDELHRQLVAAGEQAQRSLSEEIEYRLGQTFAEDRMRVIAREEMDRREAERHAGTMKMLSQQATVAAGQQLMIGRLNDPMFQQMQAPNEAMRQRYELNGKQ